MKTTAKASTYLTRAVLASALLSATTQAAVLSSLDQVTDPDRQIHKRLELYGAVRLSMDYSDSDVSADEAELGTGFSDGDFSVSSNTSTIGFRGRTPIAPGYVGIWQYEQQVDVDHEDDGDVWTTRDSFVGLDSPLGTFLVGYVNTPFKNMGVRYLSYFNATVGDGHALLGAPADGSGRRIDLRGANSVTWKNDRGPLRAAIQYSADQSGDDGKVDDNSRDSLSASLQWEYKQLQLSGAYIHFSEAIAGMDELDAYRLAAKYKIGRLQLGGVFEDIDARGSDAISREAYGLQLLYSASRRWVIGGQWNHATDSEAGDDKADQYSLGVFHHLTDQILLHAVATTTRNSGDAAYRGVDYAHGDDVGTLPGRDPWSVSVGGQLKF